MLELTKGGVAVIGTKVQAIRKEQGLSQQALAVKSGLTVSFVSKLEQGVIQDPHYSTLSQLAYALGKAVADLTGEELPAPLVEGGATDLHKPLDLSGKSHE